MTVNSDDTIACMHPTAVMTLGSGPCRQQCLNLSPFSGDARDTAAELTEMGHSSGGRARAGVN